MRLHDASPNIWCDKNLQGTGVTLFGLKFIVDYLQFNTQETLLQ